MSPYTLQGIELSVHAKNLYVKKKTKKKTLWQCGLSSNYSDGFAKKVPT